MNNTYKNIPNRLGLAPSSFEAIESLKYHLNKLDEHLFGGRKIEAVSTYAYIVSMGRRLHDELSFADKELFSVCCGVSPKNLGDYDSTEIGVCPKCKEPTNFE